MVDPQTNAQTSTQTISRGLVVIAHGSRAAAANEAHTRLCASLAQRLGRAVEPAFLELAEPDLTSAVGTAIARGAGAVDVLPYFLHPGNHTLRDIPALVAEASAAHPEVEVRQLDLFGADPTLIDVLAAQVDR